VLALVGDPAPVRPGWLPDWVAGRGWDLRWEPGAGPLAAAAAARPGVRVLLLRPSPVPPATPPAARPRVVAALAGLPDDGPVVADAARCAARAGAVLTLVHAVPRSFAERSVGLAAALTRGRRLLDTAAARAVTHEPGLPVECRLSRVRPHELVGETLDAQLLVVGGGRPQRPGPGLVACSALHHAPCPVLVVPR
jgi:nucleotide-binding universal stress UspA family protein